MKKTVFVAFDFVVLPFAYWMGFALRMGEIWPKELVDSLWIMVAAPVLAIPVFMRMGLYRAILRYVGAKALLTIVKAVSISTLLLLALVVAAQVQGIPRTVFVMFWLVSIALVAGSRLLLREWFRSVDRSRCDKTRVLIYGAGDTGAELARILELGTEFQPVGFLDDDPQIQGNEVHGIRIYPAQKLRELIDTLKVGRVLLAMPSLSPASRRRILERLEQYPVHVLSIPSLTDLVSERASISDIREVDIGDILGREVVPPIPELLEQCIAGKVVMVTGAGGSIGSELCRQIVLHGPKTLILFEHSEFSLYRIEKELQASAGEIEVVPVLGSVTHGRRVEEVMRAFGVETVYHAAAYKHVPMVEANPIEGVWNNVFGTWQTARAALDCGVETFVLISTDKAVRPTNKMGATKRLAELILQALSESSSPTRFVMVRFGNVLDSSGSVIPLFRDQIRKGEKVTVTHPEVIRYFMTIPEAAQLVLQAGAMGEGGDVFVLDMGDPVRIDDLARKMIRLSGLTVRDEKNPDGDIEIVYTGLRPGEKLYEELLIGENVEGTRHPKILRAREDRIPWEKLEAYLRQFEEVCRDHDVDRLRALLQEVVAGYCPEEDVVDPVHQRLQGMAGRSARILKLPDDKSRGKNP